MRRIFWLLCIVTAFGTHAAETKVFGAGSSLGGPEQRMPAVARSAGGAVVAWTDQTSIFVAPFTPGSSANYPVQRLFDSRFATPAIAASPSQYIVGTRYSSSILNAMGSTEVALVTPATESVTQVNLGPGAYRPAMEWNGETFLIAWFTEDRLKIGRVAPDGGLTVTGETPILLEGRELLFAQGEDGALVVWQEGEPYEECLVTCPPSVPGPPSIHWINIDHQGVPSGPARQLVPETGAGATVNPAAAWNGTNFLLTFVEEFPDWYAGNHQHSIRALRLAKDGSPMDPSSRVLVLRASGATTTPSIASSPSGFFLAYEIAGAARPAIEIATLDSGGAVRTQTRLEGAGNPVLESYGAQVVLVYEFYETNDSNPSLYQDVLTAGRRRSAR